MYDNKLIVKECEFCKKKIKTKLKLKRFCDRNLQWLTKEENRRKSGKLMIENNQLWGGG